MSHYNTFRDQLAIAHPALGYALWDPDPGEQCPPVEIADVGYIRRGKFHRLFNALLPANHQSHQRFGVPEHYEPLQLSVLDHGTLHPNNFSSYGVRVSVGSGTVAPLPPASDSSAAEVSFSCKRKHGAALSLPVVARREDTLSQSHFGRWMTRHIDSLFAFSQRHRLGIEMEEIILVTGCHRSKSWTNIAFCESQADSMQRAVLNHGPSGENLPENQCLFIRGFRVKRIISPLRGAVEPQPDPRVNDRELELRRDPLDVLLEYIATVSTADTCRVSLRDDVIYWTVQRAPSCDMALVHDDDLARILKVGEGTSLETLQPDVVMEYLQKSKPEIDIVSDLWAANDESPRTDTQRVMVATLSKQFHDPPASVLSLPGNAMNTTEMTEYQGPSNQSSPSISHTGDKCHHLRAKTRAVDDNPRRSSIPTNWSTVNRLSSDHELAGPSTYSDLETSGSDNEPIASGTISYIEFDPGNGPGVVDTDVELEGIMPDNASQHTFGGWEQCADWDVVDPNERRQRASSRITFTTDEDYDSDMPESGSRGFAALRRSSIHMGSTRDRFIHAINSDSVPAQSDVRRREDSVTTVRRPSYNDAEGDASAASTISNRDQQPPFPPPNWTMFANNSTVSSTDSGERVYQGMDLDYIMNPKGRDWRRSSLSFMAPQTLPLPPSKNKQKSRDKEKRTKDEERGKDKDLDVPALRQLIGSSRESANLLDVAPWAEADDTTDSGRPSTVTIDDSFAGGLRRNDPDYASRRKEWSFTRKREPAILPSREPDGNPKHWDVWRHAQIGQIRIERATLPHSDPNKPDQERLNAEHDVDSESANTLGGPTSVVHRHSKAIAFSIYRQYSPKQLYRSSRTSSSTTAASTRAPKSKSSEPRTLVMSAHDAIFLATKRVQKHFTTTKSTSRLDTHGLLPEEGDNRPEPNLSRPRRSTRRQPPSSRQIVDLSRLDELDSQASSIQGVTPSHVSSSSLNLSLSGTIASASSTSTSQSVSSTASVSFHSETSSVSERQLSPHDEVEEESDDDEFGKPVPRASHAEAFATLDKHEIDQLKNELVPAPTTRRSQSFFQRFIKPTTGSTARTTPSSSLTPIRPPWQTLAPRAMQEEQDRVMQALRESFKDVGFVPSTRSKSGAGNGKSKKKDMLTQVPDDSLYMLLPLWPHETDPASAAREQRRQSPPRVLNQEQNLYLLVYYVPFFDKRGEDNPDKKQRSRSRPSQEGKRERRHHHPTMFDGRRGFKIVGRLITHSDLNGAGIRLPVRGLSVTGSLTEAELGIPPASLRDVHSGDIVVGACLDRNGTTIEFFPEGLEKLGLCMPRTDHPPIQLHTHPGMQTAETEDEDVVLQPLTAIGRAVVEIAWLGCMALMVFHGPQDQGPA